MTVGKMSAAGQIHSQNSVTRLKHAEIDGHVGLGTGMRLHVGMLSAEDLTESLSGQILNEVNIDAAAIVTSARVSFSIFVCQNRTVCLHDIPGSIVLRSYEFYVVLLSVQFPSYGSCDFPILHTQPLLYPGNSAFPLSDILILHRYNQ